MFCLLSNLSFFLSLQIAFCEVGFVWTACLVYFGADAKSVLDLFPV
jgi:hypothetical protein